MLNEPFHLIHVLAFVAPESLVAITLQIRKARMNQKSVKNVRSSGRLLTITIFVSGQYSPVTTIFHVGEISGTFKHRQDHL